MFPDQPCQSAHQMEEKLLKKDTGKFTSDKKDMLTQALKAVQLLHKEGFTHGDLDEGQMLKLPASSGETEGKWALSDLETVAHKDTLVGPQTTEGKFKLINRYKSGKIETGNTDRPKQYKIPRFHTDEALSLDSKIPLNSQQKLEANDIYALGRMIHNVGINSNNEELNKLGQEVLKEAEASVTDTSHELPDNYIQTILEQLRTIDSSEIIAQSSQSSSNHIEEKPEELQTQTSPATLQQTTAPEPLSLTDLKSLTKKTQKEPMPQDNIMPLIEQNGKI